MSELRKLSEVVFENLDREEKIRYLKHSLTTEAPSFQTPEPVLKTSRLYRHLADRPIVVWFSLAAVLALVVWGNRVWSGYSIWIAAALWSLIAIGLVVYFIFRGKVNAYFKGRYERVSAKYAKAHGERMAAYNEKLEKHQAALAEYNARELSFEQAAHAADLALRMQGVRLCRELLGVEEGELIALHHIVRPGKDGAKKAYDGQVVHASYDVQYICMTDKELYEINGEIDLVSEHMTDYATSRIVYDRILSCEERSHSYYSLNFFAVTTTNQDGSVSDAMYMPARRLLPMMGYFIDSVAWERLDKKDPQHERIVAGRKSVKPYLKRKLTYDQYEEAVRHMNNYRSRTFQVRKAPSQTSGDVDNYKLVKLIVERAVKRKIRESTM